jgi:hypothetical protein
MTQLILRNWANIEDRQAMVEELSENWIIDSLVRFHDL